MRHPLRVVVARGRANAGRRDCGRGDEASGPARGAHRRGADGGEGNPRAGRGAEKTRLPHHHRDGGDHRARQHCVRPGLAQPQAEKLRARRAPVGRVAREARGLALAAGGGEGLARRLRVPIEVRGRSGGGRGRDRGDARAARPRHSPRQGAADARGTTVEALRAKAGWLGELCKVRGYRYAPRLHIELYGNKRGT